MVLILLDPLATRTGTRNHHYPVRVAPPDRPFESETLGIETVDQHEWERMEMRTVQFASPISMKNQL